MTIFPFLAILTPVNPPISRRTKHWGTSGVHLRVPTLPPDSKPSPNFRHHILFSLGGQFGTPHRASYPAQESTYLKAFFLPTSTGWQLIKHQSIFKNHMSFQIYAKRSFTCRLSHNATTIHRKMTTLQRQPCSQPKLGHFLT